MCRPRRLAAKRLLALCAALAAIGGSSAVQAQEDPFALPKGVTVQAVAAAKGPGLSEISVDGDVRARLVNLEWRGADLMIDASAARVAGLPVADSASGMIALATLKVAKWKFDQVHQRLEIQLLRKSDGHNLIDLSSAAKTDGVSSPLLALRIDYDLTATLVHGRADAGGLMQATLVRGNVALTTTAQVSTSPPPGSSGVVRLDSQLQILLPTHRMTVTAGDFISAGGQSQRAVRLGGVQIASDYGLRPDLITTPLPAFTGQVAVPTGIDLINGDQRYKLGEVEPGEFTVRNVPVSTGRGEVAVITRDALGREVVQSTRFYVSRDLLAPNLSEFAVNFGFVRRRYGLESTDYGSAAASAFFRRGLSRVLTVEGSAEWTSGLFNAGARGDLALGGIALATVEMRYSNTASQGNGSLLNLGLESTGRFISARIGATLPSSNYHDVAQQLGDAAPPRQFIGQLSFDLGKMRQLQFSAIREERRYDPRYPLQELRTDVFNASFRTRISRAIDLFSSLGYRHGAKDAFTAFAGLSIQLGRGRNAQISGNGGTGTPVSGSASVSRHDIEGTPLGYALEQDVGPVTRTSADVAYRSPYGRIEGQVERVDSTISLRANARGSLILADGALFARNQSGGSYALVRTGTVDGVEILREHRPAGKTRNNGYLLVENIPAQVPISFDIDADKLPADALAHDSRKRVVVPRGAVGLVKLDVVRFRPRAIRVADASGALLPAGTVMVARPSGEEVMVGFDGLAQVNAAGGDRWLQLTAADGTTCAADIEQALRAAPTANAPAPLALCRTGVDVGPIRTASARRPTLALHHVRQHARDRNGAKVALRNFWPRARKAAPPPPVDTPTEPPVRLAALDMP